MMYVGKINSSELLQRKSHKYLLMTACELARTNQLGLSKEYVKHKDTREIEF